MRRFLSRRRLASWMVAAALVLVLGLVAGIWIFVKPSAKTVPMFSRQPKLEIIQKANTLEFSLSDPKGLGLNVPWRVSLFTPAGLVVAQGLTKPNSKLVLAYRRAGLTPYLVSAGQYHFQGNLNRQPGLPITPLKLEVGARAARVDTQRPPALVIHPLDAQGNVSLAPVTLRLERPDLSRSLQNVAVKHLLAWGWLSVGSRTGTLRVSASSLKARGERGEVDVMPGVVTSAQIKLEQSKISLNPRDVWKIHFANATDALGNTSLNGSATEFQIRLLNSNLSLFGTRATVRGTSDLTVGALVPGNYLLNARADALQRSTQAIQAIAAVRLKRLPVRFAAKPKPQIVVGPLIDAQGALLDDGTPIQLDFRSDTISLYTTSLVSTNGRLKYSFPPLPKSLKYVLVSAAGLNSRLELGKP
jgi:hypothetical protein